MGMSHDAGKGHARDLAHPVSLLAVIAIGMNPDAGSKKPRSAGAVVSSPIALPRHNSNAPMRSRS